MDCILPGGQDLLPSAEAAVVCITGFEALSAPALLERAAGLLTAGERSRAEQMRLAEAKAEFLLARALLRSILAQRLGCSAIHVPIEATPQHKPRLATSDIPLSFNVSHAGGRVALALTCGVPVGIDIEAIDIEAIEPEVEFLEIAGSHFASAERATLLRCHGEGRARCFYRLWTRKEAVVKAAGDGLTLPLDGFDVSPLLPEELPLTIDSLECGVGRWFVRDLSIDGPFAAAIAMAQPGVAVRSIVLDEEQVARLLQGEAVSPRERVA